MLTCTAEEIAEILAEINRILGDEHEVDAIIHVSDGQLCIEVKNRIRVKSMYGEQPAVFFLRATCWLAANQILPDINYTEVLITVNDTPQTPTVLEAAFSNGLRCVLEKKKAQEQLAGAALATQPWESPDYQRFLRSMSS